MSNEENNNKATAEPEVKCLSRRGFLGATAATGATAALAGASVLGSAVMSRETWAAAVKESRQKIHIGPGELDEYYGFWSGGHSGEVRTLHARIDAYPCLQY